MLLLKYKRHNILTRHNIPLSSLLISFCLIISLQQYSVYVWYTRNVVITSLWEACGWCFEVWKPVRMLKTRSSTYICYYWKTTPYVRLWL